MLNEDIITALRNAIEYGESLQQAIQVLINSGYNPREVQETSQYIGGVTSKLQPEEDEELAMLGKPRKKSIIPIFFKKPQQPLQKPIQQLNSQPTPPFKSNLQISPANSTQPLSKQLKQIRPKKHSYLKEIILLIILLFLVGILITIIINRDAILKFFSG